MTDSTGKVFQGTINPAGPPAWSATFTIAPPFNNPYTLKVTNATGTTSKSGISLP